MPAVVMNAAPRPTVSGLPASLTPFVGRTQELAEINRMLADPACRLLTLVGPGGIGKTRLAVEVVRGAAYPDGAFFVPLQALGAPVFILPAIAEILGLSVFYGCDPKAQVLEALADLSLFLALDNFEHLVEGAGVVSELLAAAPGIKVLVTSREPLNLQEEWLYAVRGLRFPQNGAHDIPLETYSAVRLFTQSARRVRADFDLEAELPGILRICALTEGLPLALELAASWVRSLSCAEIADEIARSLDILESSARNAPTRHRSMRTMLEQSWELLSAAERDTFARLSVFRGGFTREAAEAVAGTTLRLLSTLVDKSLLRHDGVGRYDLHELVRQYAEEQLQSRPEVALQTRDQHCAYYTDFLGGLWERLAGRDQKAALLAIDTEIENIRIAWDWGVMRQRRADIDRALHSLWFYYDTRSLYAEGEVAFDRAVRALQSDASDERAAITAARAMACQGSMCFSLSMYEKGKPLFRQSLAILERHGARHEMAFTLLKWGETQTRIDTLSAAAETLEKSLALYQEYGDVWGIALTLHWLGCVYGDEMNIEKGRAQMFESLRLNRETGNRWGEGVNLSNLAWREAYLGDPATGLRLAEESLAICEDIGLQWGIPLAYHAIAVAAYFLRDAARAEEAIYRALELAVQFRVTAFIVMCLPVIADLLADTGDYDRASELISVARVNMGWVYRQVPDDVMEKIAARTSAASYATASTPGTARDLDTVARELLANRRAALASEPAQAVAPVAHGELLTSREQDVLLLIAEGLTNREIAERLIFSVGTVKWYANQIYSKLGVNSRTQAIVRARELGLLA
jgi:predicted ATPase/DNA-binding CsgD family transcriptional regulator